MKINDTSTSLQRKITSMVLEVCPNLELENPGSIGRANPLLFRQRGWLRRFLGDATKLFIGHGWRHSSVPSALFIHGDWEDIEIVVLDEKFIKPAERIGSTYEKETGKSVTVIRQF